MERCFIVSKESDYFKDLEIYIENCEEQRQFIIKFFKEKGIEASQYIVGGDGFVNCPFNEYSKKSIKLRIVPTDKDFVNFGKMLCKKDERGLCAFRKSSSIGKEFTQRCIDEKVVINLYPPRVSDYFQSLGFMRCSYEQFKHNDKLYLKVSSERLKENDTPEGFKEIKLSEYYLIKEEYEKNKE